VCGFTAHHVISANVSHEKVLERMDPSDLGAALKAPEPRSAYLCVMRWWRMTKSDEI
jgi:hypothetical protein